MTEEFGGNEKFPIISGLPNQLTWVKIIILICSVKSDQSYVVVFLISNLAIFVYGSTWAFSNINKIICGFFFN